MSHDRPDETLALVDELDAGSAMGDFDRVIGELASRRDALAHTAGDLGGWRRLRSDVFAAVLDTRRMLVDQPRLFIAAIADDVDTQQSPEAARCEGLARCRVRT